MTVTDTGKPAPKAATAYLHFDEEGEPYLRGVRCTQCEQIFLGDRDHCAKCFARNCMTTVPLSTSGRLYNYSIVHRSYTGVTVPFISAIVDLDCGCTVKGNLLEIEPTADALDFNMRVNMVFRGAGSASSAAEGFVSHFFVPALEKVP